MATLCGLANLEVPSGLDSISFAPKLLGEQGKQQEHEYLYWEFYEQGYKQAVRAGDWKLVIVNSKTELHNLKTDLGEKFNVASEHPEIVEKLKKYMDQAHVSDPNWIPKPIAAAPLFGGTLSGVAVNARATNQQVPTTDFAH